MIIVVMSCDRNQDLGEPFHICLEKYGPDHPEVIYNTETFTNPGYKTVNTNYPTSEGTKRVVDTVKPLKDNYILLMVDDLFLRKPVDNKFILSLEKHMVPCVAAMNFEPSGDGRDIELSPIIKRRFPEGKYKTSCMCQLWRKDNMLKLFKTPMDPGSFEKRNKGLDYGFLISTNGDFLDFGKRKGVYHFGIVQGKGTKECKEFFDKEGITGINYKIRGFIDN